MNSAIREFQILHRRFDPAEMELGLSVHPERLTPRTQVRGRLMGPRCPYSNTVEIAYPWRELTRTGDRILLRAVIPEPSLWDPQSPFVYEGPLELWEGEVCLEKTQVRHGLRLFQIGPRGFRLNGRLTPLRGIERESITEQELRHLRQQGFNLLILPATGWNRPTWEWADRWGLLLLGRWTPESGELNLERHACSLGFLNAPASDSLCGWEWEPGRPVMEGTSFLVCSENEQKALPELPRLVRSPRILSEINELPPGWLGWVLDQPEAEG